MQITVDNSEFEASKRGTHVDPLSVRNEESIELPRIKTIPTAL